jgi:hypothetical protein
MDKGNKPAKDGIKWEEKQKNNHSGEPIKRLLKM